VEDFVIPVVSGSFTGSRVGDRGFSGLDPSTRLLCIVFSCGMAEGCSDRVGHEPLLATVRVICGKSKKKG